MFQTTNQLPTFALMNIQDTWSASSFLDLAAAAASWQGSHLPRRTCGVLGAFLGAWCVNGHPTRWTFCWEYDEPVDCDTMVLPTFPQLVRHSWAREMVSPLYPPNLAFARYLQHFGRHSPPFVHDLQHLSHNLVTWPCLAIYFQYINLAHNTQNLSMYCL